MTHVLSVSGLKFPGFGPFEFQLGTGECIALSGVSGSGKTRLLRALADLDPNDGDVRLEGRRRKDFSPCEWRARVGLVPSETAWWASTVGEHFRQIPDPLLFERLGFDSAVMQWEVNRCSSGERQRLGLLRTLVMQPLVLLLDEPTANLDAANRLAVEVMVADYQRHHRTGVVWVSHDNAQRIRVARRSFELCEGQLVQRA